MQYAWLVLQREECSGRNADHHVALKLTAGHVLKHGESQPTYATRYAPEH